MSHFLAFCPGTPLNAIPSRKRKQKTFSLQDKVICWSSFRLLIVSHLIDFSKLNFADTSILASREVPLSPGCLNKNRKPSLKASRALSLSLATMTSTFFQSYAESTVSSLIHLCAFTFMSSSVRQHPLIKSCHYTRLLTLQASTCAEKQCNRQQSFTC